jgi:hypothetical protein
MIDPRIAAAVQGTKVHRRGDVEALERVFGVALPADYRAFMERFDGGRVQGPRAGFDVWSTTDARAMHRENDFSQKRAEGSRLIYFGTDGGSFELFFDVDDRFGRGRFAVLAADRASDAVELHGASFTAAMLRVIEGGRSEGEPVSTRG